MTPVGLSPPRSAHELGKFQIDHNSLRLTSKRVDVPGNAIKGNAKIGPRAHLFRFFFVEEEGKEDNLAT